MKSMPQVNLLTAATTLGAPVRAAGRRPCDGVKQSAPARPRYRPTLMFFVMAGMLSTTALSGARTVVTFNQLFGEFPEGVAVDHQRNVYVSLPPLGQVRRIASDGTQTVLASLEMAPDHFLGVLGVAVDHEGVVYAAAPSGAAATHGVVRIAPNGDVQRLPGSEAMFFPNSIALAPGGTLYVTESSGAPDGDGFELGAVWRIRQGGSAEVWLRHETLTGTLNELVGVPFPLGANGIAHYHNAVYVANSERMHIVRIGILPNGDPAEPEIIKSFPGPLNFLDGLAADNFGNLYTVFPALNELIRISRTDGSVSILATGADELDFPTSVAIGEVRRGQRQVYVANFAVGPFAGSGPSVVRVDCSCPLGEHL